MDAVPADSHRRDSSTKPRTALRIVVLLLVAVSGLSLVMAPPSLWLNAAAEESAAAPPGHNENLVDVRIEGNTTIPAEHIAKYIKTRPGRPFNERQVRDDVKSLYGTRWFFSVEPRFRQTENGPVLVFRVIERPVVKRVVYKGNKKISSKKLASLTGLKQGSPFDVSANRQSVRRILAHYKEKGFAFAKVELERGGEKDDREVVFRIDEGPKVRVTSITFEGNEFVSDAVLRTKIRTSKAILWLFGGLYDPETIPDDVAALKQYYHNLGFFDVEVTQKTGFSDDRSRAYFKYHIKEDRRYKIRRLVIQGNRVLPTKKIREDLKLTEGSYFNAHKLAKDVDGIKAKYGAMGRLFAKVDAAPRFYENDDGTADLVYTLDEDFVYRIRRINVVFRDNYPHTKRTAVLNRLLIAPGDLADPRLIRRSESRLKGVRIFDDGRQNPQNGPEIIFRRVKPEPERPYETFRGQNGQSPRRAPRGYGVTPVSRHPLSRHRTEATSVRKHLRRRGTLPRENPFKLWSRPPVHEPGDLLQNRRPQKQPETEDHSIPSRISDDTLPFTNDIPPAFYLRKVRRRPTIRGQNYDRGIEQPGIQQFNNDPNRPIGPAIREGDLDVVVSETQTGRLMFGVGVNSDAGVVGSIVLNEYNFNILRPPRSFQDILDGRAFRGGAQRFRLGAAPGDIVSRYLVSWTDPFIFDTDYSLSLSGFYYNRFFEDWDERRTGGRVSVGRQFTPEISVTGTFRIEEVVVDNPDFPTPQILIDSLGNTLLTTVGASIAHDTRDQAFLPGEGHLVDFLFEHAVGEFQYPKMTLNGSQYFTVYQRPDGRGRHILTLRGQLGWTDSDTPIFERLYAGGFQTFRGFEFRGVTPRDLGVRIGGRWLALGSVEYMVPVTANEMLHGVAFTDFGTVENDFGFDEFRVSVGVGVRISIPQMLGPVPLAFDFAFPVLKEDFDDERIFNFYVGFTK